MGESLFYNRDVNISGISVPSDLADLNYTPVYGSQVVFEARNHSYPTDDFYNNLIPMSLNSLTADFKIRYDVDETGAQKLVTFFESQSGYNQFSFVPDTRVYRNITGVCDNYAVNFINNQHFEVAANVSVDSAPTLLNWSGGTFTNLDFQGWDVDERYFKYAVVYSGVRPDGSVNASKLDNFYYATGDHRSTLTNSPTGASSMWTQMFFFEPDIGTQNNVDIKADRLDYKNSFIQHFKTNNNVSTFDMSYTYKNITDHQLKGMLHFLENKGGYRRFEHQIPSVYNRPKVYYCPRWTHTWVSYNANDLTVELVEDPLGVIPTGT
jgi:phage-related protein